MKSREEKFYIVKVTHPKDMHEKEHDIVVKRGDCASLSIFSLEFAKYKPDTKEKGTVMTISIIINLCFCKLAVMIMPI